ncbi:hypothetical protein FWK35_00010384, partial [Aphis craccivora]
MKEIAASKKKKIDIMDDVIELAY